MCFLINFCLDDLSIGVSGMLKSPLLLCYCRFPLLLLLAFALCIEVLLCWVHKYLQLFYLLLGLILIYYVVSFFVSCNSLYFKVYFVWCEYCYSSFLLISILIIGNFWLPICIYRLGPTIILLVAILIVSDWGSLV